MEKKYWKGVEELDNSPEYLKLKNNEFYEHLPIEQSMGNKAASITETTRRDFLKYLGFGVAAASLAACETPIRKSLPYVVKPEEIIPGVPNFYASTFSDGHDFASVLVKTREGRPIKLEPNDLSPLNGKGLSARVQASVLGLYDNARAKKPLIKGMPSSWSALDKEVKAKLADIAARNGNIRILSSTISSPSTKKVIADFIAKYPNTKHISYDAISAYGILKANELSFQKAVLPSYHFENADVIVGFGCDFLANWISPVEYSGQYAKNRKINKDKKTMSRHIQIESTLSLTGSNADDRIRIRPSEQGAAVVSLYNKIAAKAMQPTVGGGSSSIDALMEKVAEELWNSKGKSLVVSGSNNINEQVLINGINMMLGSYDSTIDIDRNSNYRQG